MTHARKTRLKWRLAVWLVLVACVAIVAVLLVQGFLASADFVLKAEAFLGFFVVGCVLLLLSRNSGKKQRGEPDR
jgi:uncharacterized membrane protein YfcA